MDTLKKGIIVRNGIAVGFGDKTYSTCPIGTVLSYAGQTAPNGYLICDGASYKVADYLELYNVIGNTYGGDAENFNVPNLVDKFIQGSTTSGTEKEAGLPNITGSISNAGATQNDQFLTDSTSSSIKTNGALSIAGYTSKTSMANGTDNFNTPTGFKFDASLSNPIYGNSDTVQPPALTMVYIIKAFHTNEGVDSGVSDDVVEYVDGKINDITTDIKTTWSSNKINEELEDVRSELDVIIEGANKETPIDDTVASLTTVWSSKKTSEELTGLETEINNKADKGDIYTKTETDEKITEKVSEIVAGAPDDFDTLKEMSDWLTEHEDSAASMNSAIQKNAEDIATANSAIQKNKTDISTANTNIQKNVNDITALKNDVAINKSTLGIQCKNLLNPDKHTVNRCTEEKDGDTYTVTNAGTWSQWYWFIKGKTGQKYILTFEMSELTGDSTVNDVYIKDISTDTSILNFAVRKDGVFSKEFTAVSDGNIRIGWCPNNSGTDRELSFKVSNFMCRSADITDSTYEPYTPSLQEQINSLLARIEALETTTTEGGE